MSALLNVVADYRVVYPAAQLDTTISGFTPNQIKEQLATVYKELAGATVQVNNGTISFALPSGQKN